MTFDLLTTGDGVPEVRVTGELDISNIERLEAAVTPLLESKPDRLVVDVSALRFADSSAITLWVRWASQVGELELREPPVLLRTVLGKMGLAERLRLSP